MSSGGRLKFVLWFSSFIPTTRSTNRDKATTNQPQGFSLMQPGERAPPLSRDQANLAEKMDRA
jgi:hypothetical protein